MVTQNCQLSVRGTTYCHCSRLRCRVVSCRCQSYFVLKVSVQNVHWYLLIPNCRLALGLEATGFLRLRLRKVFEAEDARDSTDPIEESDCAVYDVLSPI